MIKLLDGIDCAFEAVDPALYNGNSILCFCLALFDCKAVKDLVMEWRV